MKRKSRRFLAFYLLTGAVCYGLILMLAGGLGLFAAGGVAGLLLEFAVTVIAWPVIVLLSVLVVMQGR